VARISLWRGHLEKTYSKRYSERYSDSPGSCSRLSVLGKAVNLILMKKCRPMIFELFLLMPNKCVRTKSKDCTDSRFYHAGPYIVPKHKRFDMDNALYTVKNAIP
jgi:hypothetical protein